MLKKSFLLSVFWFSVFLSAVNAFNPLSPTSPTALTDTGTILTPVVVSGTESGFMAVCNDESNALTSIFASDGISWNSPVVNNIFSYTGIWTSGTSAGFMATYIGYSVGYTTAAPTGIFSQNQGSTWINEAFIENNMTVATPVAVSGTAAGFMATWLDTSDSNAYSSLSSNNGVSWSVPVKITNSGLVTTSPYSAVIVSGSAAGFLAAWQQTGHHAYTSFYNGTSWSTPAEIPGANNVGSDVWVSSNSSGFMATWTDLSSNAYASFSSDNGSTWSAPVIIVSGVLTGTDISVAGATSGFVVAWIDGSSNANASFSSDNGATWSTPVAITNDGSVMSEFEDTSYGFVSVCAVGNNCVFGWLGNGVVLSKGGAVGDAIGDAYSSFSTITLTPSSSIEPPTNLAITQTKNDFGLEYELVNLLKWSSSPTAGIAGYAVYRNGVIVSTVNASTFQYEEHKQKKGAKTLYSVTAFDGSGNESSPASTSLK